MIGSKIIACIIPARLKSTRFPRKMLSSIGNKPLLQHVWDKAKSVSIFDHIAFAVDAEETASLVRGFGGVCYMTPEQCTSGTDRLVYVMRHEHIQADVWVNWQGDEPFITENMIQDLLQTCETEKGVVWTLKKRIIHSQEISNPHIAKVVCDYRGYALYFSRSMIPFYRDLVPEESKAFYKHVGLYAFTQEALEKIAGFSPCAIEMAEQLEQLRFLYYNLPIKVHETSEEVLGIDLPEHLAQAEAFLKASCSIDIHLTS